MTDHFYPNEILDAVAQLYQLPLAQIRDTTNRAAPASQARETATVMMRERGYSWPEIAGYMGQRYHSSVYEAAQRFGTRPHHWQRADQTDIADIIHCQRQTTVRWAMASNSVPMMLHRLADLLINGRVGHRAAGLTLRRIVGMCELSSVA